MNLKPVGLFICLLFVDGLAHGKTVQLFQKSAVGEITAVDQNGTVAEILESGDVAILAMGEVLNSAKS